MWQDQKAPRHTKRYATERAVTLYCVQGDKNVRGIVTHSFDWGGLF